MGLAPIEITPARLDWLEWLAEGDAVFTARTGLPVEPGWVGFPDALGAVIDGALRDAPDGTAFGPQLVFDPSDGALVGFGGWTGPPDATGTAELGYAIAPGRRGRGLATAFVDELVAAGRRHGVRRAVAHTLPEENASVAVLRKQRFRHVATIDGTGDPDAPRVWRWERTVTERLTIEPRTVDHAERLCAALAGEEVGRYIGGPEVTTVEAMVARIRYVLDADPAEWGERWLNWVVFADDRPGRPLVGRIEATVYVDSDPLIGEIAYVFGPAWSGRGYATEASRWMLDHLRDEHAVVTAFATVHPENAASVRLLERLGFAPTGDEVARRLGSYDEGDLVFEKRLA